MKSFLTQFDSQKFVSQYAKNTQVIHSTMSDFEKEQSHVLSNSSFFPHASTIAYATKKETGDYIVVVTTNDSWRTGNLEEFQFDTDDYRRAILLHEIGHVNNNHLVWPFKSLRERAEQENHAHATAVALADVSFPQSTKALLVLAANWQLNGYEGFSFYRNVFGHICYKFPQHKEELRTIRQTLMERQKLKLTKKFFPPKPK